jgi:CubicO group peptidase (beta-lactamase class C family)
MTLLAAIHDWPVDHVAAAAVLPDGRVVVDGDDDRVFELASLTKLLVAMATLVAVEDGSLDLDEPAGPPGSTLRHLLSHASGLDATTDRVLAAPGTRRIYSNTGFEHIGRLLVDRTGLDLSTLVAESVFHVLGMEHSAMGATAATGATGTVADLARLAADLLAATPRTLAPATRDAATQPAFPDLAGVLPGFGRQDPNEWGLGFELRGTKEPHWSPAAASPATFGHFGRAGSLLWVDPHAGAALAVLGDRPFGDWAPPRWRALGDAVLDTALGGDAPPAS